MLYAAYGAVLSSTVPLPELAPHAQANPDLFVTAAAEPVSGDWQWLRPLDPSMATWLSVATGPAGYRLVFDGGGEFVVSIPDRRITTVTSSADADTIRHLLIDQVVPLVLSHGGQLVLHASAVEIGSGAIALIGPPGAGKSTLTASFGLHSVRVLADDAVVVDERDGEWMARPAYGGLRLWPDMLAAHISHDAPRVAPYTDKRRLSQAEGITYCPEPRPLRCVYVLDLEEVDDVAIEPLSGRASLMAVVGQTFLLDASDASRVVGHFDRAHALCRHIAVRRLRYPRRLEALGEVRAALAADAPL